MAVTVRSFAKINIGLHIGSRRADGFHELRTIYQTVSLHDLVRVDVQRGAGVELRCKDARVPCDETNTCWRIAERLMKAHKARGKVVIAIDKQLPVQGGIGGASSNAAATLLGLERALNASLEPEERWRLAAEVGSDVPLFLVGGSVLGVGRGEKVFPLHDLPPMDVVLATPFVGVSTPQAFADWDAHLAGAAHDQPPGAKLGSLTLSSPSDTINSFSQSVFAWLMRTVGSTAGVPASSGDQAEISGLPVVPEGVPVPLLDLVRAGIENDFERVVFPKYPELHEVKRGLERAGARYASLSGSGSTVYGLFESAVQAQTAAEKISESGCPAVTARTLPRNQYWAEIFKF